MRPTLPNKDVTKVVRKIVATGKWEWESPGGSKHGKLRMVGQPWHRVTVSGTPKTGGGLMHMQRRIKHCEEGRCEHER